ncbi:MAG: hypothetical protein LUG14_08390 [Synergistaceae bacterium]|nr:hypothetical protein [Synergistaceae bacterium]
MSGFITWRGVKLFIILAIVLYFPAKLEAGEVYKSHYAAFCAAHENLSSSLSSDVKKYYLESHAAFMKYLAAERENLAIFHGVLVTRKKEKLYIYRNTLNAILKRRIAELESLHEKNGVWFSLKTRDNLARAFAAVNQRVPYDRGEKLRPTFRDADRAWKEYVRAERIFYSIYFKDDQTAPESCDRVLRELRTRDLLLEHKGVAAIKIEKEE